jgi:hypothetical protein
MLPVHLFPVACPFVARTINRAARWFLMEYRGKRYTIVQGIGADSWKWTVYLDDKTIQSGAAKTQASAATNAIWAIDKALAPKKVKLKPATE